MDPAAMHAAREKGRGVMRGLHLGTLEEAGRLRAAALAEADTQLQRIGELLQPALDTGLNLAEISRLTGVSRPTLYELRAKYGDTAIDSNFTLLQTIALRGPLSAAELVERIGDWSSRQADEFVAQDLLELTIEHSQDGDVAVYGLTYRGFDLLEHWKFDTNAADGQADR